MNDNIYNTPESEVESSIVDKEVKTGIVLKIFLILIVLINLPLSFLVGLSQMPTGTAGAVSYAIGQVFVVPLLIVGLFQIGKRYRNTRSRYKIFFWSSIFVLFSIFGNIVSSINPHG